MEDEEQLGQDIAAPTPAAPAPAAPTRQLSIRERVAQERQKRQEQFKASISDEQAQALALQQQRAAEPVTPPSLFDQMRDSDSVALGVGAGLLRVPAAMAGGAVDTFGDLGHVTADGLRWLDNRYVGGNLQNASVQLTAYGRATPFGRAWATAFGAELGERTNALGVFSGGDRGFDEVGSDAFNEGSMVLGSVLAGIATLRAPSQSLMTSLRSSAGVTSGTILAEGSAAAGLARFGAAATQGVVAEVIYTDPDQERLANVARDVFGFEGELVDFLALDEDDTVFERRLAQAAEGVLAGVAFEGVINTFKWARALAKGDEAGAAQIAKEQIEKVAGEAGLTPEDLQRLEPEYELSPEPVGPDEIGPSDNDLIDENAISRIDQALARRDAELSNLTEQYTRAQRRAEQAPNDALSQSWLQELTRRMEAAGVDPNDLPDPLSGVRRSVIEALDKEAAEIANRVPLAEREAATEELADMLRQMATNVGNLDGIGLERNMRGTAAIITEIFASLAEEMKIPLAEVITRYAPNTAATYDSQHTTGWAGSFHPSLGGRTGAFPKSLNDRLVLAKEGAASPRVILHEHAHWYLDLAERAWHSTDGPDFLKQQYKEIADWLGYDVNQRIIAPGVEISKEARAFHEKFAENFEYYIKTGQAPTERLKAAFEWLRNIIQRLSNLYSNGEYKDPRAKAVYDRMLGGTAASPFKKATDETAAAAPVSPPPGAAASVAPSPDGAPAVPPAAAEAPEAGGVAFEAAADLPIRPVQGKASGTGPNAGVRGASTRRDILAESASRAAQAAGLPEGTFTPENIRVTGSGRVVVTAEQYERLARAGLSEAFIQAKDVVRNADQVLIKETVAGSTRILGSLSREDLARLQTEIRLGMGEAVDGYQQLDFTNLGQLTLTFGEPGALQALLKGLVRSLPEGTKKVRNDAAVAVGARELANAMATDETAILGWARDLAGRAETLDVEMKALETVFTRTVKSLEGLTRQDIMALSEDDFRAAARQVHNALTLAYQLASTKSGLGRALRQRQLPDADTYIKAVGGDDAARRIVEQAGGRKDNLPVIPLTREELKEWVQNYSEAILDPKIGWSWITDHVELPSAERYLRTAFANFFSASILSGARTIALNVVAPSILGAYRTAERTMGSAVRVVAGTTLDETTGRLRPLTSTERRAALASSTAAWRAYTYAAAQIPQAFTFAVESARRGRGRLGSGTGLQDIRTELFVDLDNAANVTRGQRITYALGNMVNLWPRQFGRLAIGLDEFTNYISYSGEIAWRAIDDANQRGLGLAARERLLRERMLEARTPAGQATNADALREAQRTTLTSRIQGTDGPASRVAATVNSLRREVPELRYILPVWNIPMNGLGETLRRIPVSAPIFDQTRDELLGRAGPAAQADAYGRMLLGAGLTFWAFNHARSGMLTGAGPQDPEARKVWLEEHQPYSIKIGDQWIEYGKFDVVGSLMSIPATLYDATVYRDYGNENQNVHFAAIGAIADFLRNRAALEQASRFISMDARTADDTISRFIQGMPASFIPAPVRDMRNLQAQGLVNEKSTFGDYVIDSLPFAYRTLTPRRDIFGRPVHGPRDTIAETLLPFSLKSARNDDPATSEIVRIAGVTGIAPGVPTGSDVYAGSAFDPRKVKLEDGTSILERFIEVRGRVTVNGRTLNEAVLQLIESPEYKAAVDADSSNRVVNTPDGQRLSKGFLLSRTFSEYSKRARTQLARESETAARYMAVGRIRASGSVAIEQLRTSDVVEDPSLLAQVGLNLDDYVRELQQGD